MVDYPGLLDDLAAEEEDLDALVAGLDEKSWRAPTPAAGWDVRDSVAHLATSEELAALALSDPGGFTRRRDAMLADLDAAEAEMLAEGRARSGPDVLDWWRRERAGTLAGLSQRDAAERVAWVTGLLSAASFATARLMETWAHGYDVAEALGVVRAATARLRHVADLGVRTMRFSYVVNGLPAPDAGVRVELAGPGGEQWTWGESTRDLVRGDALDFCLVVTKRRSVAETALEVVGPVAREWTGIAQAFAGPPSR